MVPCNDRGGVVVRQRTGRRFLFVLRNDRDVVRVLLNVHVGVGVLHDVLTRGRDLALKLTEHFVVRQELIQVVHVDLVHVLHHLHAESLGQVLFLQIRRDLDYAAVRGPHVHQVTTFVVLQPELSPRQELAILQVLFVLDDLDVVGELVLVGVRLGLTVLHRIFHPHHVIQNLLHLEMLQLLHGQGLLIQMLIVVQLYLGVGQLRRNYIFLFLAVLDHRNQIILHLDLHHVLLIVVVLLLVAHISIHLILIERIVLLVVRERVVILVVVLQVHVPRRYRQIGDALRRRYADRDLGMLLEEKRVGR